MRHFKCTVVRVLQVTTSHKSCFKIFLNCWLTTEKSESSGNVTGLNLKAAVVLDLVLLLKVPGFFCTLRCQELRLLILYRFWFGEGEGLGCEQSGFLPCNAASSLSRSILSLSNLSRVRNSPSLDDLPES